MLALIIDNYDSFTYNIVHTLDSIDDCQTIVFKNDQITMDDIVDINADFVVLSPGPGHPESDEDFGVCGELLKHYDRPILGVCLGYQGLALHFGGKVQRAPLPIHGQTSQIFHNSDELFNGIPQGFDAVRYHSLSVDPDLGHDLELIAWTNDGMPMAIRHKTLPFWGVQFHPESICSQYGKELLANFISIAKNVTKFKREAISTSTGAGNVTTTKSDKFCTIHRRIDLFFEPEEIFTKFYSESNYSFWLDSSRVEEGLSRYSVMGEPSVNEGMVVKYDSETKNVEVSYKGQNNQLNESIFDFLEREMTLRACDSPELDFQFNCGFVGYFGYELKNECGGQLAHSSHTPDAIWLLADRIVVFDCLEKHITLIALTREDDLSDANTWIESMERKINEDLDGVIPSVSIAPNSEIASFSLDRDQQQYLRDIDSCMDAIVAGDSYEICLTNHLTTDKINNPLETYRVLRKNNPAPYSSFLSLGDISVLCSSPERFLKIDQEGLISSKPIKGTAARHSDNKQDEIIKYELSRNTKDRAENLMIVDLIRNDLSKVCERNSVIVSKLMEVESYQTVHQLVSTVEGKLRSNLSVLDCIKACFPGGSMTGAPKIRSMEIIDSLENHARGIYSGTIGYLALNGCADLNIVIRTAICSPEKTVIGVGGAIIALSDANDEFDEILLKGSALVESISAAKGSPSFLIENKDTLESNLTSESIESVSIS